MSEIKTFKITKTTPGTVLFRISPASNNTISRLVTLTDRNPHQVLPLDWALGIFLDSGVYALYQQGAFTCNDNEGLVKAAYEAGVYFDDKLDFTPTKQGYEDEIFAILSKGNRAAILDAIKQHGDERVRNVAIARVKDLTQGVVSMLETYFHIQLTIDGASEN